jgi:hypothetical protein
MRDRRRAMRLVDRWDDRTASFRALRKKGIEMSGL